MGKTFFANIEQRLARYRKTQARKKARAEERQKARKARWVAGKPRRYRIAARKRSRTRKRIAKEELRALLARVRQMLGYKPGGMSGKKLSAKHIKALAEGRRRYWQAKRQFSEHKEK